MVIETSDGQRWRVVGPYKTTNILPFDAKRPKSKRIRKITGYSFWTPDGCERFVEGSRESLKEFVTIVCENYGTNFARFI